MSELFVHYYETFLDLLTTKPDTWNEANNLLPLTFLEDKFLTTIQSRYGAGDQPYVISLIFHALTHLANNVIADQNHADHMEALRLGKDHVHAIYGEQYQEDPTAVARTARENDLILDQVHRAGVSDGLILAIRKAILYCDAIYACKEAKDYEVVVREAAESGAGSALRVFARALSGFRPQDKFEEFAISRVVRSFEILSEPFADRDKRLDKDVMLLAKIWRSIKLRRQRIGTIDCLLQLRDCNLTLATAV
jgi:hypothetical protein